MQKLIYLTGLVFLTACGNSAVFVTEKACTVSKASNGAIIQCADGTNEVITNGIDGLAGHNGHSIIAIRRMADASECNPLTTNRGTTVEFYLDNDDNGIVNQGDTLQTWVTSCNGIAGKDSIIQVINPCNKTNLDEQLFRLSDRSIICFFESGSKRYLTTLVAGTYRTTDKEACEFTLDANGKVTDSLGNTWE